MIHATLSALAGFALATVQTPTTHAQCEPQRFFPDFEPRLLEFGQDVAISDEHLLVNDRFADKIYAYERDGGGNWVFTHTVPGASGGDIELDGNKFITGSLGVERYGGAVIYDFDGARWIESGRLGSPDIASRSPWGETVAIFGQKAAVANWGTTVLAFTQITGQWQQVGELRPSEGVTGRVYFGNAIVVNDEFILVGAPGEDTRGIPNEHGAVYVYRWDNAGSPELVQKLEPGPVDYGPNFGFSLAIEGDTLVVGAIARRWVADRSIGAAYVYHYDGDQWVLHQELLAPQPQDGARFGWDVSLQGDLLAIGARGEVGTTGVGAAHLFQREADGQWRHAARIVSTVGGIDYAESVDLGGGQLAIGCSEFLHIGEDQGMAEVYDLACLLCAPDLDADGALTIFDFLTFLNLFQAGDPIADFDGDGELTIFDFLAFQTAFDAGCS
ncbi:MAG: FG-GAP repeat protein [Phycisphaera sp.]|nr:MAG: FG-GAP repeat protein [Phycisphaera sp.]